MNSYYKKTQSNGANPWLIRAMSIQRRKRRERELSALDIGCGTGGDAIAMAKGKYEVYALDRKREAFKYLRKRFKRGDPTTETDRLANWKGGGPEKQRVRSD